MDLLEVLEQIVLAVKVSKKQVLLRLVNVKLEVPRHLWRMAWEIETVSGCRFEYGFPILVGQRYQMPGQDGGCGAGRPGRTFCTCYLRWVRLF